MCRGGHKCAGRGPPPWLEVTRPSGYFAGYLGPASSSDRPVQHAMADERDSLEQARASAERLLEVVLAMTALDFSRRAPVGASGDVFDALAAGVNMLTEEL